MNVRMSRNVALDRRDRLWWSRLNRKGRRRLVVYLAGAEAYKTPQRRPPIIVQRDRLRKENRLWRRRRNRNGVSQLIQMRTFWRRRRRRRQEIRLMRMLISGDWRRWRNWTKCQPLSWIAVEETESQVGGYEVRPLVLVDGNGAEGLLEVKETGGRLPRCQRQRHLRWEHRRHSASFWVPWRLCRVDMGQVTIA
jgi:hypothetical protein